ncbi:MAG: hypothetical protein ACR2OZ_18225 [Verrucomicrobiales bacterium]
MRLSEQPDLIERYKRLRIIGRGLVPKVLEATRHLDFDMIKAAKKLTLPVSGRTLIFDEGETDTNAFIDFYLHEFRVGGRRVVDCCDPEAMGLSPDERDLLEAHRSTRASLFDVLAVDAANELLQMRDLLASDKPDVRLTDLSLSSMDNVAGNLLLFVRVLACQGIEMSSGCFFSFSPRHRQRLLDAHALRMKTVAPAEYSQRTFIFFYQRHREFGEAEAYAEVT